MIEKQDPDSRGYEQGNRRVRQARDVGLRSVVKSTSQHSRGNIQHLFALQMRMPAPNAVLVDAIDREQPAWHKRQLAKLTYRQSSPLVFDGLGVDTSNPEVRRQ